jgi:hypothetical protein
VVYGFEHCGLLQHPHARIGTLKQTIHSRWIRLRSRFSVAVIGAAELDAVVTVAAIFLL